MEGDILTSASLKVGLAVFFVLAMSPLGQAHECQPGVYSVDPNHRVYICNDFACVVSRHVCVPRLEADTAGVTLDDLLP